MTRAVRISLLAAASAAALVVLLGIAGVLALRSAWFDRQVRTRIVDEVETATGGRVEIGAFRFNWRELRAEVTGFVLHGTEPAGRPPLLRADRVSVGLKIISLARRDVDIESLQVVHPQAYLVFDAEGRSNIPQPKIRPAPGRTAMEDILDLAIGRFSLENGAVEVESRGRVPLDAHGRNLRAKFLYQPAGPLYRGEISIDPLEARFGGYDPVPLRVSLTADLEKNRIRVAGGKAAASDSEVSFSGSLDDFVHPRAQVRYELHVDAGQLGRILRLPSRQSGSVESAGSASWSPESNLSVSGSLRASDVNYRDPSLDLRGFRAEGAIDIAGGRAHASALRLSGDYADRSGAIPVSVRVASLSFQGDTVDARGCLVAALGGTFAGDAELRSLDRYRVTGELAGFDIQRLVARYSTEALPWDGRLSGQAVIEGAIQRGPKPRAAATLSISPAGSGAPVHGRLEVNYDAARGILDLGRSFLELPHSRLELSGSVGQQLRIRLETRDLADVLPALGAGHLPLRLSSGAAVFSGTVAGRAEDPRIAGHLSTGGFSYAGEAFDSLQADLTAGSGGATARNVQLARGKLRALAEGSVALAGWKVRNDSTIVASGSLRDASLTDLLALAGRNDIEATGSIAGTAQAAGTWGDPRITGDVTVTAGTLRQEPFDRFAASVVFTSRAVEVGPAQLAAGSRRLDLRAAYEYAPWDFSSGRLRFGIDGNEMGLDQFRTLAQDRPGLKGTVRLSARGSLDILPARPGEDRALLSELHADLRCRGLQLTGQPLGDLQITAESEGGLLRAHLASDFANSRIRGDGEWRLTRDYPGSATVTLSRLDFQELRAWIAPNSLPRWFQATGSAEGDLRIDGPAGRPELLKAQLRIPKLEAAPGPGAGLPGDPAALTIRNQDPIVVSMANQVVTVESARLVGRDTDLSVTGRVLLRQRNPLDLRVSGRVNLAVLQDLDRDFTSSGSITADAAVRGSLASPQCVGKVEFQDAAFNLADVPNGISRARGVVLFDGERATIQSFTGETGGGKITLSGFADYGGGTIVFRVKAAVQEVRVRYPEGVSTVADADLLLAGTSDRSMLSGSLTVLRTGFNLQSDFSSILAKSAEPVRTPSARTGFLGGLSFDVQISSSPDITFQSPLAEGLQIEANLRLRGTASNPAVLGRVNITQGRVAFFGTRYTINQGSISFLNPVRVEPVLNIDLETRARGVDIILTVSGPLNKLSLTPRSDPPLQFSQIVALLATGRTPTTDPTLLAQQSASPQSWQQMGAFALLGQAIANPVAGRLQRFFGVSQLKIDPGLIGLENNPQARVTLEQQVTPSVTFTYITNVTSSNPLVVRVEWAFSRNWSAVALREENGMFGLDFFYRRRF